MADNTLNASQRAQIFAMSTRQNWQMLAKETATVHPSTIQFTLPKTRLLSSVMLRVKAKINIKHASKTALTGDIFTPYRVLRKISLDLNNGFAPFSLSGEELAMYNMINLHPDILTPHTANAQGYCVAPTDYTASTSGADNEIIFTLELPLTTNPRDPVGLIVLQSDATVCTVSLDTANGGKFSKTLRDTLST